MKRNIHSIVWGTFLLISSLIGIVACVEENDLDEMEIASSQHALTSLTYHGGSGGTAFTTVVNNYYGYRLRYGSYVDQLKLTSGYIQGPYGGNGGTDSGERQCGGANDWIVGVYGRAGAWIDQLGFICGTPDRSRLYKFYAFGGEGGTYFEETCPTGMIVKQVTGRSGNYLDGIQVHCGTR